MRIRGRIKPDDVSAYIGSLRVIENQVKDLAHVDAKQIANEAVLFLRDRFPKSKGKRRALFGGEIVSKGPPLAGGWRKYPSATLDGAGFTIRHVRAGDERTRTILASIDQGSKAFVMKLRRAKAFAFLGSAGQIVIRNNDGESGKGRWAVAKRDPMPDKQGYIKPTFDFIKQRVNDMVLARRAAVEEAFSKKLSRGELLRQRHTALLVRKKFPLDT